jgi:hypothetical protein
VSNLGGERRQRLQRIAEKTGADAEVFYLQVPAGNLRSPGWYLPLKGETLYLGYSFADAEIFLRERIERQGKAA